MHYEAEMRQISRACLFERKEYAKALPYLEAYASKASKLRREDGYTSYLTAITRQATGTRPSMVLNRSSVVKKIHWRRMPCTCWRCLPENQPESQCTQCFPCSALPTAAIRKQKEIIYVQLRQTVRRTGIPGRGAD